MTWGNDPRLVAPVVGIMMGSRQAVVDYMTPLGLAHLMGTGHHYGPAPWVNDLDRPEWNPAYYHRADSGGIGFERILKGLRHSLDHDHDRRCTGGGGAFDLIFDEGPARERKQGSKTARIVFLIGSDQRADRHCVKHPPPFGCYAICNRFRAPSKMVNCFLQ